MKNLACCIFILCLAFLSNAQTIVVKRITTDSIVARSLDSIVHLKAHLYPSINKHWNLGSAAKRWDNFFVNKINQREDTTFISGARFYSGGGDNGGAFDGDYNLFIGEEAGWSFTPNPGFIYGVSAAFGYAALRDASNGSGNSAFGAGAGRNTVSFEATPGLVGYNNYFGLNAGRDVAQTSASHYFGASAGQLNSLVDRSIFNGYGAGYNGSGQSRSIIRSIMIGPFAGETEPGKTAVHDTDNIFIGFQTGLYAGGKYIMAMGSNAYFNTTPLNCQNVYIFGHQTAITATHRYPVGLSNTITFGTDVIPSQANTINWPTNYNMGIGTITPSARLHLLANSGKILVVQSVFSASGNNDSKINFTGRCTARVTANDTVNCILFTDTLMARGNGQTLNAIRQIATFQPGANTNITLNVHSWAQRGLAVQSNFNLAWDNADTLWRFNSPTHSLNINTARVGIGVTPFASLNIRGGTTTVAPLRINPGAVLSVPENGSVEYADSNFYITTGGVRYYVTRSLMQTIVMDFPSTAPQTGSDLVVGVTGAVPGDVVQVGIPLSAVTNNSSYTAWVSGTDQVTIRYNNYSALAQDPLAGTFRVSLIKY